MKNNFSTIVSYLIIFVILILIYKNWFLVEHIIGGDWPFFHQEAINNLMPLPPAWSEVHGNGMGGKIISYPLDTYLYFTGWLFSNVLHVPWDIVYKIFWFGLFLLLSILSSTTLVKYVFPESPLWQRLLGSLIYTANTYILLVVGGGQMGIALAYALSPFVLISFFKLIIALIAADRKEKLIANILPLSLSSGLLLAVLVLFDIRVVYLVLLMLGIFLLFHVKKIFLSGVKTVVQMLIYIALIPFLITILLHAFWLLPLLLFRSNPVEQLGTAYTSLSSVKFFSFAQFENTIALLHPYWPENIFGKVGFMRPEYLLMPILVFGSLLAINERMSDIQKRIILFFAFLGIVGAFLAKGANEPFGQLYLWLFQHIPGFIMFRDPTKFYIFIIFSYALLLPYATYAVYNWLSSKKIFASKYLPLFFVILTTAYVLFLIRPALTDDLQGTFQKKEIPNEYIQLKDMLINDTEFYRTLWVPQQQRFTFSSNIHPSIEAGPLFDATGSAELLKQLRSDGTKKYLSDLSVGYIIVPYDSLSEILLTDRKYDKKVYNAYVSGLEMIPWLERDSRFKKIAVFKTRQHNDHVTLIYKGKIKKLMNSSVMHSFALETEVPNKLVFSENYHPSWQLQLNNTVIKPQKTEEGLQQYELPVGKYTAILVFTEQQWYKTGAWISLVCVLVILLTFFMLQYKNFLVYLKETF